MYMHNIVYMHVYINCLYSMHVYVCMLTVCIHSILLHLSMCVCMYVRTCTVCQLPHILCGTLTVYFMSAAATEGIHLTECSFTRHWQQLNHMSPTHLHMRMYNSQRPLMPVTWMCFTYMVLLTSVVSA